MNRGTSDEELWDSVRIGMETTSVERASREEVIDIAATEISLMELVDRGERSSWVTLYVAGHAITGRVFAWTDDLVILGSESDSWAVRIAAIDAIEGLCRALHIERPTYRSSRSYLDEWTGNNVEVWTRGGRFRGVLVVASDHLELGGKTVIPWVATTLVHRRA